MALYPEIMADVAEACELYRREIIREEELQRCLWKAVQTIVAIEEKELRDFLQRAEGQIELLRFTVDRDCLYRNTLATVEEIEMRAKEYLSS